MTRVFNQPGSQPYNYDTITDGVLIAATGIRFVNTEAGRIYGGIVFGAPGSTIENQQGGIIGYRQNGPAYEFRTSVTGSDGIDTIFNAGSIRGTVSLGAGNDSFHERGSSQDVDLGDGDDSYVFDAAALNGPVAGGGGNDSLTISSSADIDGSGFSQFEHLTLADSGNLTSFSGYATIELVSATSFNLIRSTNNAAAISLAGQTLGLGHSSVASVTGTAAAETLSLFDGSRIVGNVSLGDGNDLIYFSEDLYYSSSDVRGNTIGGSIDGGEGRDTLQFAWFETGDHQYDLSELRGIEVLSVNSDHIVAGVSNVSIRHADGFDEIRAGRGTALLLADSNSPDANVVVVGGDVTLNAGTTLRRIGFPEGGPYNQSVGLSLADDTASTTVANHGTITGEVRFYTGDDLYDGTNGSVGGAVYGNAGNDTLLGGSGREVMAGGYGADRLDGNGGVDMLSGDAGSDVLRGGAGADLLSGGAGDDLFAGTRADLAGDTITDLSRGDRIAVSDAALDGFGYSRIGGTLTFAGGGAVTLGGAPNVRLMLTQTQDGATLTAINRDGHIQDFDGDGHSDILWRNADGAVSSWTVSGNARGDQVHQNSYFSAVDPRWHIAETFDFDGDGRSDILWRNADGSISVWRADAGGFAQGVYNHGDVGGSWAIAATGDYDGDGKDDILWRDAGGAVSVWRATGTGFAENSYFHGAVGAGWKVAGSTDLDGDGRDDLVWRNDDGSVATWLANGNGLTENTFYQAGVPTSWHIAGLGDLNGDGRGEIVWRDDDGRFSVWQSTGSGFREDVGTQSVPTSWHIEQVGDFNDDGRADIMWRNDSGQLSTWQSNGDGFDQDVLHSDGPASGWSIQSHEDLLG